MRYICQEQTVPIWGVAYNNLPSFRPGGGSPEAWSRLPHPRHPPGYTFYLFLSYRSVKLQSSKPVVWQQEAHARVPVRLSCHMCGSSAPEVTVIWLHNGDIVEPDDYNPISAIPNGDWSYQTQVSLLVAPVAGDTYMCSVQHVSLQEPLLEDGSPGLMPEVTILVAVATVLMVLGLGFFLTGVYHFRARPPDPGYTPLPEENYSAGNGVPIPVPIGEGQIIPSLTLCVPPFPRQHLRTPRRTSPRTGGSRLAPSQTQCHGADNKDAPQAPLVSVQSSGHMAEAHRLLRCLTKRSGCMGAMAWDPKGPSVPWGASGTALLAGRGKGSSRSAQPAAASPQALRAAVGTAADEGRETVREPPREGYEDGEGSAGQGV
ncbi:uncharacterized protein [Anas acuta]|uniref:uncharacterized protein n=1 Tax=Anas acuta TaxID=28680 RepID=UPI0035C8A75A